MASKRAPDALAVTEAQSGRTDWLPAYCPVAATLAVIGGKWKPSILYLLHRGATRFNALQRALHAQGQSASSLLGVLQQRHDYEILSFSPNGASSFWKPARRRPKSSPATGLKTEFTGNRPGERRSAWTP